MVRLGRMMQFSGEISHRLNRARVLANYSAGIVARQQLCDADFILVTASRYHGFPAGYPCPVCESEELRQVYWVYGDALGKGSATARSVEEIERFAVEGKVFRMHTVEVCPDCRWNHLLKEVTVSWQAD